MDIAILKAEVRDASGTRAARRLRDTGQVPGIIYGHERAPETVSVSAYDLVNAIERGAHVIEINLGAKKQQALIKEVQYDHLGDQLLHVDFVRVSMSDRVQVSVPLEFKGIPAGAHDGGTLDHGLVDVEIECLVTQIPEVIRVNVADMHLGDILHVSDLELPEGMTAVSPPEAIVCSVRALARVAEEEGTVEAAEGEAAEPEIIGRKEKEQEQESSES